MTILHIVRNKILNDARVTKEIETLAKQFPDSQFSAIGYSKDDQVEFNHFENLKIHLILRHCKSSHFFHKALNYMIWVLDSIKVGKKYNATVVHCHDIDALLVGVILKLYSRCQLIFDAHELQSEQWNKSQNPFVRRILTRSAELILIRFVDHLITVSQSILNWYIHRHAHLNGILVRNVPTASFKCSSSNFLRDQFKISQDELVFIYLGVLDASRGLLALLNAFSNANVKHHIVFMGSGDFESEIKNAERLQKNIHYHPPVPFSEVLSVANSADVGISFIPSSCLNFEYCLPNKVFEYILSGLPVVSSNLTEIKHLLTDYQAGWIVDDEEGLRKFLLTIGIENVKAVSCGLRERSKELTWENEARGLISFYEIILKRGT